MNLPTLNNGMVSMPRDEFETLLEHMAERGARAALAEVGLEGEEAAKDIREMRDVLEAFNAAKRVAWTTVVKMLTTGLLLALVAGAAVKLKLFGGAQ